MNTVQIAYALEQDPKTTKMFCGVFPSDKLPQTIDKYPCGLVANTDPSMRPGGALGIYPYDVTTKWRVVRFIRKTPRILRARLHRVPEQAL